MSARAALHIKLLHGYRNSHGRVLQHVGDDEEPNHAPADVHLVQLGYSSIAAGDRDVLEGNIQVIFG